MAQFKKQMLESEIEKIITVSLRDIKDPRVCGKILTINRVDMKKDKSVVDIYISCLDNSDLKETVDVLNRAKGFFRSMIAQNINIFKVPDVAFHENRGIEQSVKIHKLLDDIKQMDEKKGKKL
jgi:ribosome-binding factor A